MDYQPRTIAFLSDLAHPPQNPDPRPVQRLHNRLFEASPTPTYATFAVTPVGPVLANPQTRPGASSQVAFLADRLQFREELGDLTAESFGDRVLSIAREAVELRNLPLFTTQQVTLRSLVNPRHWPDTRVFLREAVFGFGGALQTFESDPALYGLRLAFPPNPSTPHAFQLRMESYQSDPRSLFLEITGNFPPIPREGVDIVSRNVVSTYAFLTEHVLPFVACFDARQPS